MADAMKPESFHNYLRLCILLNGHGCEALRQIFLARYQRINSRKWQDGTPFAKEFLQSLCKGIFKPSLPIQKKMVAEAELNRLDLMMLARFIQNMDLAGYPSTERQNVLKENAAVNELNVLRNKFAHLPGKTIEGKDFGELWNQARGILVTLGVPPEDIDEVKNAAHLDGIELKTSQNAEEQMMKAKKIREAGNLAMQGNDFEKGINFYSEALLIRGLPHEERGLLHSNRSHAYLKSVMDKELSGDAVAQNQRMALEDAEEVMELRPTWWKGYFRAGRVHQFKRDWKAAIDLFDRALALNPGLVEVVNCRDECRYDLGREEIQEHINSHAMPYGLQEQLDKVNKQRGMSFSADVVAKQYERLLKSKDPGEKGMASLFFGDRYMQGVDVPRDYKRAAEYFQEAVDAGMPEAMGALGTLYMEGKGVQRDVQRAVRLFESAVQCKPKKDKGLSSFPEALNYGITHGQFQIGKCYQDGTGKPLDYYQAFLWYKRASDGGHAGAANNLGILYHMGRGVEKCPVKAKQYWSLAASRGNELAMDSLAWEYLRERDLEQAQNWYAQALEAGNVNSILHKESFYSALEDARSKLEELEGMFPGLSTKGKNFDQVKTEIQSELSPELAALVEAFARLGKHQTSMTGHAESLDASPLGKYWTHLEEITKRANAGHPFAQKLLTSMGYFSEGMGCLKKLCSKKKSPASEDTKNLEEQCIQSLANCFRATEIVAFFDPSELPELARICKAKMTNEKSDLDLAARVVYSIVLSYSQSSEILSFMKISTQKYPEEEFLYKMHSGAMAVTQDFQAAMKVCEEGLKRFPKSSCLLYCKAGAMKMTSSPESRVIAAYHEFIKEAPFDDRMIPEAYYNIAFSSLGKGKGKNAEKTAREYYSKGLEEEAKLLPCFIPHESQAKTILEVLLALNPKGHGHLGKKPAKTDQPSQKEKPAQEGPKPTTASMKLQLANPTRLQFVNRHRETLKMMAELYDTTGSGKGKYKFKLNMSIQPKNDQQMPKDLTDIQEIRFRDMNPRKDHVYKKRMINLLISEDPMFGLYTAIHVVVRDDNGDCLNCSFYELDHNDPNVRENLCFGSRISVLNPYYRLAGDGSVTLRVDDPKSIIYHWGGKEKPICRYCWKESPPHACSRCSRAKYCGRDCQTQDWKVLNHKLICKLKYFNENNM